MTDTAHTYDDAIEWCHTNGVQPDRDERGKPELPYVPPGVKVPGWLVPALEQHDGELPVIGANGAVPKPTRADRRLARDREQAARQQIENREDDTPDDGPTDAQHLLAALDALGEREWTVAELLDHKFAERKQHLPGVIEEGVTLLAGKSKIGKTWLILNIALALEAGGMALGKLPAEKTGVLLLALEDGPRRLQDRFAVLLPEGGSPPRGLVIRTKWPRENAAAVLDAYLTAHPEIGVVIVDTLILIRPQRKKGGDLFEEDYSVGAVMKPVSDRHRVAVVLVYHTVKGGRDDPLDEVRDTMGLTAGVDNIIVLRRKRGATDATLFVTGRDVAEEREYALTWEPQFAQWTVVGDAADFAISTARKLVLDALPQGPPGKTPTEVARAVGKPLSTVKSMLYRMSRAEEIGAQDGRYFKTFRLVQP